MDFINETFYEDLSSQQMLIIKQQMERFNSLRAEKIEKIVPENEIELPEGTLIHGTPYNKKSLESIAKTGIITGDAIGIQEDGETFYCADFHRVSYSQSLKEYNEKFPYRDGRCPFGNLKESETIAFIIYPCKQLEKIAKYDCYRDNTKESDITKSFVNMAGLPIEDKKIAASILFGIPSNFINGIVLPDRLVNKDNVSFLMKTFPGVFISRKNGAIIYKEGYDIDKIENVINLIQKELESKQKDETIELLNERLAREKDENSAMWRAIAKLPMEQIVSFYFYLGYQGDVEMFNRLAQELKQRYGEEDKQPFPKK